MWSRCAIRSHPSAFSRQIAALEQRSAPGDTVLIYFSGHGTSANDNNNSYDLPYATGAWVPYDLDYSSNATARAP